jgi:Family of unknown function (DUF6335)
MPEDRMPEKQEIDANDVIRDYAESSGTDDEVSQMSMQMSMQWYEQAQQDTKVPPEAVVTGGDIDAAWDQADVGEETVGGTTPTPDQDIVDEIGRAVGLHYEDAEPLHTTEKVERRDEHRWELHPASSEDFSERTKNYHTSPGPSKVEGDSKRSPSSKERRKPKAA